MRKSKLSKAEVNAFRRMIHEAEQDTNRGEYNKAKVAEGVDALVGSAARVRLSDQLGLSPQTAKAYMRRLECLLIVPDEDLWLNVGWSGVQTLARMDPADRRVCSSQILSAREGRDNTCPDWRVKEILAPYAKKEPRQRKVNNAQIAAALEALGFILDNYDLDGYEPPESVVELLSAQGLVKRELVEA